MATISVDTGLQSLWEIVHDLHQGFQCDFIPCLLQCPLQRFDIRMRFSARFSSRIDQMEYREGSSPGYWAAIRRSGVTNDKLRHQVCDGYGKDPRDKF